MKIIMPIAGKGTRLRPHTHVVPKSLIRVAGKPIINYIMDQIQGINFSDIIFIIGHLGDQIRGYLTENYQFPMRFIRQIDFHGLGHAIFQARDAFPKDEPILILLGDIIFTMNVHDIMKAETNMLGVMKVADPRSYGIVMTDENGIVTNMMEKPEKPPTNIAIAGIYYFQSAHKLFASIEHIIREKIMTRGEYQLTDAMKHMMYNGEKFKTFDVPEWYDCGEKDSLLDTNRVMLDRYATNDRVSGSIVIPPVFIGNNCDIRNSILGPNVSISEGSTVVNSIISNSILGIETSVENTILESSLIGDNAFLAEKPREFNIGPDSEMIFTK
jgi:glucose-1-phosphate thymidylyltransferase